MTKRTRMVLIGGFLGAGKTTLINLIAENLVRERIPVGIVTNDQGQLLVDTEFIRVRGLDVEEVPGGCFCCNFQKLLDNAERLVDNVNPEFILAEPVGSCTDLIATVATPMRTFHRDAFSTAPLIVLVDGPRMLANALDPSSLGGYLRRHQVEEGECLVLSKTDELGDDDVRMLMNGLKKINPQAEVIEYSAVTGTGMDRIMDVIASEEETGRGPVDVDYDIYADAEAELGWYNGVFEFDAPDYDSYDVSMDLLRTLASGYTASDIAHAKVALTSGRNHTKVSLIGNEFSIGGVHGSRFGKGPSRLNFNARVVSEPEPLRIAIRETVDDCFRRRGVEYTMTFDDCFSPGRPNPTYRLI